MDAHEIRRLLTDVRAGRLSRRAFTGSMLALGLTAPLAAQMNDLVIQDVVVIPLLWRNGVSASSARLRSLDLTGWDSTLWHLAYWYNQA